MEARPGQVIFAPGGQHMVVRRSPTGRVMIGLDDSPPRHSCKPAVDVLFDAAVTAFGSRTLAVMLTGMGADGLEGSTRIHAAGGTVFTQDEGTSVVWGMPGLVAKAGIAQKILPLTEIAPAVTTATADTPAPRSSRPAPAADGQTLAQATRR